MSKWISVADELPKTERKVIGTFVNQFGKRRTIFCCYVPRFTVESNGEDETYDEYSEERDEYYLCEGWYEMIENWGDFSSVYVCEGEITHWMPKPPPPEPPFDDQDIASYAQESYEATERLATEQDWKLNELTRIANKLCVEAKHRYGTERSQVRVLPP